MPPHRSSPQPGAERSNTLRAVKARRRLSISVLLVVSALALPAAASGATEFKISTFELQGSNGYEVGVSSAREGIRPAHTAVRAVNGPLEATYEVRAEVAPGIHATFGSLGQLDVSFERRRKEVDRVGKGCRSITETGIFRGSLQFVGEGGYFSSEAVDPEGEVWRLPDGFCVFDGFRRGRPFLGFGKRALEASAETETGITTFEASKAELRDKTLFIATLRERVDGMNIERMAHASGGKETFSSSGALRAGVHPPVPFIGSARFRDTPGAPPEWTGSLSVPMPGAPEIQLAGEAFAARLCPRISILSSCLKRR
jgi:hypothetical protein